MADYRPHYDDEPRRPEREGADRVRDDAPGAYRTDDRGYHDRYRTELEDPDGSTPPWARRERGGYWRNYQPSGKGTPSKSSGTTT